MSYRLLMQRAFLCTMVFAMLAVGINFSPSPAFAAGTITGRAFRDFNGNGVFDTNATTTEVGQAGAGVTAYDSTGAAVGTTFTGADGTYSLSVGGTGPYRVEFTLPSDGNLSYLKSGAASAANNSNVQFVPDGNSVANFSIGDPELYCQENPDLCTTVYRNGDPLAGGSESAAQRSLVRFSYYSAGNGIFTSPVMATSGQTGSVWGEAFQRSTKRLFSAAFLKRHAGMGPQGAGGIYITNTATGGTTSFNVGSLGIDVAAGAVPSNAARGLPAGLATPSDDTAVFDLVAKVGIGGLAMDEDTNTLYMINLADKRPYGIKVGTSGTPTAADVTQFATPAAGCQGGEFRPFGAKVYRGALYMTAVCDAQGSQNPGNLEAIVYRYNVSTPAAAPTQVLRYPLNYPKGPPQDDANCGSRRGWYAWTNTETAPCAIFPTPPGSVTNIVHEVYPTPVFSGLDFDLDGSMIMGFFDRYGHQMGFNNKSQIYPLWTVFVFAGGDILRAYNNNGTYVLESGGTAGPNVTAGGSAGEGPGNREFYQDNNGGHHETADGGIAFRAGSGRVATTANDPYNTTDTAGGVNWLYNNNGVVRDPGMYLYSGYLTPDPRYTDYGTFGKANGVGDLELLCDSAPIELGNRVWRDNNNNGIQDPNEPVMPNVTVQLVQGGTVVGTTTTNATGTYLFTNANVPGGIKSNTDYEIRIDTTQTAVKGTPTTKQDNDSTTNGDLRDSDAAMSGTNAVIPVTTGKAGASNHTLDFGFTPLYSLGNRVFADTNNNGVQDTNDAGIGGVSVSLFRDANGDGTPDSTTALRSTTTDSSGYYRFDDLVLGGYVARIDPNNFVGTGALAAYTNSTPTNAQPDDDKDKDDNGINNATPATNGILSGPITLGPGISEPVGEADVSPSGQGQDDNLANMTLDFGFYKLTIGNQLWVDHDNNGTLDTGETGTALAGTRVELYDGDTLIAVTTTNASGSYLFDRRTDTNGNATGGGLLPSTAYNVRIPASEFEVGGTLERYVNSTSATKGTDNRDNGIDDPFRQRTNGIRTAQFALTPGQATGGATVDAPTGTTANPTLDFGFFPLSLGNRVFTDANNNGVFDGGDTGLPGVTVNLYRDSNNDGTPDGPAFRTQQTIADGYYLFTGLPIENYIVEVVPPAGYRSSTGKVGYATGPFEPAPDPNSPATDNDDNGTTSGTVIRAKPVKITVGGAPTGEPATPGLLDVAIDDNSNLTVDFGLFQPLSLGNQVWNDVNNNGLFDAGEKGIPNVPVTLYYDTNNDRTPDGPAIVTINTDANGNYLFDNLIPGNYIVDIVPPAGFQSSTGANGAVLGPYEQAKDPDNDIDNNDDGSLDTSGVIRARPITLAVGSEPITDGDTNPNSNLTVDFGLFKPATLGDFVWYDTNKNGQQDTGEKGVPGVTVTLYNAADDSVIATTTTDTDGKYTFPVGAGQYYVVFTDLPTGYGFTTPDTGSDNTDSDANKITGRTPNYTVAPGDTLVTVDAGLVPADGLTLGNLVWADKNNNGLVDAGEPGVKGVVVQLLNNSNTVIATTSTDANGNYQFFGLQPGDYSVRIPASEFATGGPLFNWTSSTGGTGNTYEPAPDPDNNVDNDDNGTTSAAGVTSLPVTLATNTEPDTAVDGDDTNGNQTVDFGVVPQLASIGDFVWFDKNRNNVQDTGEVGVPGVIVKLYQPGPDGLAGTADDVQVGTPYTTGTDGKYQFTGLIPGDYFLVFDRSTLPADYRFVSPDLGTNDAIDSDADPLDGRTAITTLVSGENDTTFDAGMYQTASIGNFVWSDTNNNGKQDPGEPGVPNVTVNLIDSNGNVVQTTKTDPDGKYEFTGVEPGSYTIQVVPPAGYTFTPPNSPNATDDDDSDVDPTTGKTTPITLNPGDKNTNTDAGLVGTMSLGGNIWSDNNNNGKKDPGEPSTPNTTVTLYRDSNKDGVPDGPAVATTTTDANGNYVFPNLTPDTYVVEIQKPAGYTSSTGPNNEYEPGVDANNDVNNDDNGSNKGGTIISTPITLEPNTEPTTDGDSDPNSNLTVGFGVVKQQTVGNLVWDDKNNNGVVDPGEPGIPNVPVTIYRDSNKDGAPDGPAVAKTTTDANGNYQFTDLLPDTYVIEIATPAGYTSSTGKNASATGPYEPGVDANNDTDNDDNGTTQGTVIRSTPVTLTVDNESVIDGDTDPNTNLTVDFGIFKPGIIGDYVWNDSNNNGKQDPGEKGVPGTTVTLYDPLGTPVATTTTDANGGYTFTNLIPGTYSVGIGTLPPGSSFSPPGQGDGSQDSDVDPSTGRTTPIVVNSGDTVSNIDIGISSNPTAVTLTKFSATRQGDKVNVTWTTSSEVNTWGFHLLRSTDSNQAHATRVTSKRILAQGRGKGGASYAWVDESAEAGVTYTYWLEETEVSGETHTYGPAAAQAAETAKETEKDSTVVTAVKHQVFMPAVRR